MPILVLLASSEPILAQKWRQDLVDFAGMFPAAKLNAAVAAVSRVPQSAYGKLARKGNLEIYVDAYRQSYIYI